MSRRSLQLALLLAMGTVTISCCAATAPQLGFDFPIRTSQALARLTATTDSVRLPDSAVLLETRQGIDSSRIIGCATAYVERLYGSSIDLETILHDYSEELTVTAQWSLMQSDSMSRVFTDTATAQIVLVVSEPDAWTMLPRWIPALRKWEGQYKTLFAQSFVVPVYPEKRTAC